MRLPKKLIISNPVSGQSPPITAAVIWDPHPHTGVKIQQDEADSSMTTSPKFWVKWTLNVTCFSTPKTRSSMENAVKQMYAMSAWAE